MSVKCPHCLVNFYKGSRDPCLFLRDDEQDCNEYWWADYEQCPNCEKLTVWLGSNRDREEPPDERHWFVVYPKRTNRPPPPSEVPEDFTKDYLEACLVHADSPKASAALSRRCLQHLLREKAKVKQPNDLAKAIQEVIDDPAVPSDISATLDMVRNIGNFSAHPNKSLNTGEIVDVEPEEAEWCLDTLEVLFDFYFVRPADIKRRMEAVNVKLADTGKPQMPVDGSRSLNSGRGVRQN